MSRVSVITPTYNRAHVIGDAIASVRRQTYQDFEHIIVDDGSTDRTTEIVGACAEDDERIEYIRLNENRGHAAAQNIGLDAASGEFVTILDSDDTWMPHRLERAIEAIEDGDEEVGGVCHRFLAEYRNSSRVHPVATGRIDFQQLAERNVIAGMSNTLFRSDVFDAVGGFDESMASTVDYEFQLRALDHAPIIGLEEVLSVHRKDVSGVQDCPARKRQGLISVLSKHHHRLSDRNVADRLVRIGRACLRLDRTEEARKCFERATTICPASYRAELSRTIGVRYLEHGKKRRARRYLMRSLRGNPTDVKILGSVAASLVPLEGEVSVREFRKWQNRLQSPRPVAG